MPKKSKSKIHITWNKKEFICKNSINSMSAVHTKIYPDGTAVARLSDCHGSIKWHNNLNDPKEVKELIEKLSTARKHLEAFEEEIKIKLHS